MRILVNLAAPAGFACGAEEGEVGRYGALVALNAIDPEEPVTIICLQSNAIASRSFAVLIEWFLGAVIVVGV